MKIKTRNKYIITVLIMVTASAFNLFKIPIQDNWVVIIKWSLGLICTGFCVKKITDIWSTP